MGNKQCSRRHQRVWSQIELGSSDKENIYEKQLSVFFCDVGLPYSLWDPFPTRSASSAATKVFLPPFDCGSNKKILGKNPKTRITCTKIIIIICLYCFGLVGEKRVLRTVRRFLTYFINYSLEYHLSKWSK